MNSRGGSQMRLRGLLYKEFKQILRDPSSLAIAFVMPVVLLLIFGYGVSLDAKHVPVGMVADSPGVASASLFSAFEHSRYFSPRRLPNMREAQAELMTRRIDAIVHLQSNFSAQMESDNTAPIQLIVNGVDANQARLIKGYVGATINNWLEQRAERRGIPISTPVMLEARVWFNPEVRSREYLVPGLIAVIMTLIGALLTALVMAREWERGTLEALMVTPVTLREILLGKLIPYFILGMCSMLFSLVMGIFLFAVPLRGNLFLLLFVSALFLLASLGMGLLISILARNQFVASLIAILVTFLPAFMLSGFLFDISSMPGWLQALTHIVAARYFVNVLHTLFLAGDVWAVILPNTLALALMALLFLGMARLRIHKRLE